MVQKMLNFSKLFHSSNYEEYYLYDDDLDIGKMQIIYKNHIEINLLLVLSAIEQRTNVNDLNDYLDDILSEVEYFSCSLIENIYERIEITLFVGNIVGEKTIERNIS
ncbi:hypothetical protein FCV41_18330 [Clostridium argentinense]|nr:hypothetical protein [Clostridium argentinense]NFF41324.1 hypothetical protein [Clostridium argentinense]